MYFSSDLGSRTEEILFELYDRFENQDTFLGLGIVGMEELLMNPSQRQIIPLQARPYENDPISGTLTLEVSAMKIQCLESPIYLRVFSYSSCLLIPKTSRVFQEACLLPRI
jgi:hypothetical protein